MKPSFSRRAALLGATSTVLVPGLGFGQPTERPAEGGLGGTGIVGVVTDLAVLRVGGSELLTDANTSFSDGFGAVSAADVTLGTSLTVEAASSADGLLARRIFITYPLIGAVAAVTPDGREFQVNGVVVRTESPLRTLAVGDRVKVSGLWDGDSVVASAVIATNETSDLVSGTVSQGFTTAIGPIRILGPGQSRLDDEGFGTVIGQYDLDRNALVAELVTPNRFIGAAGPLTQLAIEGYLEPTRTAPGYRIAGLGHSFARNLDLSSFAETRVLFRGGYDGVFRPTSGLRLPEATGERRSILRQL
ncbi:MAG: DUF5666 domain-containing protein [Pseudomonadota bacterium]